MKNKKEKKSGFQITVQIVVWVMIIFTLLGVLIPSISSFM